MGRGGENRGVYGAKGGERVGEDRREEERRKEES